MINKHNKELFEKIIILGLLLYVIYIVFIKSKDNFEDSYTSDSPPMISSDPPMTYNSPPMISSSSPMTSSNSPMTSSSSPPIFLPAITERCENPLDIFNPYYNACIKSLCPPGYIISNTNNFCINTNSNPKLNIIKKIYEAAKYLPEAGLYMSDNTNQISISSKGSNSLFPNILINYLIFDNIKTTNGLLINGNFNSYYSFVFINNISNIQGLISITLNINNKSDVTKNNDDNSKEIKSLFNKLYSNFDLLKLESESLFIYKKDANKEISEDFTKDRELIKNSPMLFVFENCKNLNFKIKI